MDLELIKLTPPWDWPEDIGETLLAILSDDQADQADRLAAAQLAGDCVAINDELVSALLAIICSPRGSEPLRARAAIALGPVLQLGDEDFELEWEEGFEDLLDTPISEGVFHQIQDTLYDVYLDDETPKEVRRKVLEASVRNPRDWHEEAIRSLYSSDDDKLKLTAVFCMAWIGGFDAQILEALESENADIHLEAVWAAGNWAVEGAWSHVLALVNTKGTKKSLLLAAISAVANIRPLEARAILDHLSDHRDEEISEAVLDALVLAEPPDFDDFDDDDDDDDDVLVFPSISENGGPGDVNGHQS